MTGSLRMHYISVSAKSDDFVVFSVYVDSAPLSSARSWPCSKGLNVAVCIVAAADHFCFASHLSN